MSARGAMLRDLILLAIFAVLLWLFPKTVLAIEGVCGVGTLVLFAVERGVARKW